MTHDELARVIFYALRNVQAAGIDTVRQAHAIAAAVKIAEAENRRAEHHKPGPQRKPINHGTAAGYFLHIRRGEDSCQECRDARNAEDARRKTRRTA